MRTIATLTNTANYRQRVELDGVDYALDLRWNAREGAWKLGLSRIDGTPLVVGLTLVSNRPMLERFRATVGVPPGEIIAFDQTATIPAADYDQLGPVVDLLYYDAAELPAGA